MRLLFESGVLLIRGETAILGACTTGLVESDPFADIGEDEDKLEENKTLLVHVCRYSLLTLWSIITRLYTVQEVCSRACMSDSNTSRG